jgi:hypothetical protein
MSSMLLNRCRAELLEGSGTGYLGTLEAAAL